MKRAEVPAVLARHGIAPDADAGALLAALAARGWRGTVEEGVGPGGHRRYRALATRVCVGADPRGALLHHTYRAQASTAAAALAVVLARALERGD